MADSREVMNIRQASQYLGVSPDTLYKYVNEQKIPAFKLGNRWRFKKSKLDQWMEEKSMETEPQGQKENQGGGESCWNSLTNETNSEVKAGTCLEWDRKRSWVWMWVLPASRQSSSERRARESKWRTSDWSRSRPTLLSIP